MSAADCNKSIEDHACQRHHCDAAALSVSDYEGWAIYCSKCFGSLAAPQYNVGCGRKVDANFPKGLSVCLFTRGLNTTNGNNNPESCACTRRNLVFPL